MVDLYKVRVVEGFWYQGRHYIEGEELHLPFDTINNIGVQKFIKLKYLDSPRNDKMIRSSIQK